MIIKKRLVVTLSLFVLSLFLFPTNTKAAGVYFCRWAGTCVSQADQCGVNFKENCAQFDNPAACQNNQQGEGNSDCVPNVVPPSAPPSSPPNSPPPTSPGGGGTCATGTCTTNADCGGNTCRGANSVSCTGVCDCPPSKCNAPSDCNGQLSTCLNPVAGAWCAGSCSFSEEDAPPYPDAAQKLQGNCPQEGSAETAIGCIPYNGISKIVTFFLSWGLGIGGGVVLLTTIAGAIQVMTSAGDPTKLSNGKDLIFSAVSGLILLIFCIFLLRLIGVNILGLF